MAPPKVNKLSEIESDDMSYAAVIAPPGFKPIEDAELEVEGGTTPSLWGDKGVKPAGVRQGGLGDCWFLAVGAGLAEHPARIHKLFNNMTSYPANGAFEFTFYSMGKPVKIVIDDRLPV